jgi:hypothetical protein
VGKGREAWRSSSGGGGELAVEGTVEVLPYPPGGGSRRLHQLPSRVLRFSDCVCGTTVGNYSRSVSFHRFPSAADPMTVWTVSILFCHHGAFFKWACKFILYYILLAIILQRSGTVSNWRYK